MVKCQQLNSPVTLVALDIINSETGGGAGGGAGGDGESISHCCCCMIFASAHISFVIPVYNERYYK